MEEKMLQKTTNQTEVMNPQDQILGFEESKNEDTLLARVKVVNALSPERKDKTAEEGDIIISLTGEHIGPDDRFIPVKQYYSNIEWNPDRNSENRILCRSFDGKIGVSSDGTTLSCAACKRNQFDNSKTGKEAQPKCTAYMNFLGFFTNNPAPVVLSFSKTNYNEGKKMLSIAKSLMKSLFSYTYKLESKLVSKNNNEWYIIVPKLSDPTPEPLKEIAMEIYRAYEKMLVKADYEETVYENNTPVNEELANEI